MAKTKRGKTALLSRRTPTPKQQKLIRLLAENVRAKKPKTKGELLLEAGYSKARSISPKPILDSPVILMSNQEFANALKKHSERALALMESKASEAGYNDLRQGLDSTRKNVALLEGTSTENIGVIYKIIED